MRLLSSALLALVVVAPLGAQVQQGGAAAAPIALDGKLNVDGGKHLKAMQKVIVPTVIVRFAAKGSLTVVNQGHFLQTDGNTVKAKGKFIVGGLEKAYLQDLAKQLQEDFVRQLRAQGYTVLTWADVKDHEEVAKMKRFKADEDWGMPTDNGPPGSKNTYLKAFPTDEQGIDPPMQGYAWGFRKVMKDLEAGLFVPEYIIDAPLLSGSKKHGVASRGASVTVNADMMANAYVPFVKHDFRGYGSFRLKEPVAGVAEDVGTIGEAEDDSPKFANAISAGLKQLSNVGGIDVKSGTWGMKVDRAKYTAGVLRAGASINAAVMREIAAEKAK